MTNTTDLFKPLRVKDFIRARAGDGADAPTTWLRISYIAHLFTQSCAIYAQTSDGIDAPAYALAQYASEDEAELGLLDLMKSGLTDSEQNEEAADSQYSKATQKTSEQIVVAATVPSPVPSPKPVARAPGPVAQSAHVDDDIMNIGLFDKLALNKRASVT